ncbi:MAG TPA: LysM peptidoglycan-binding domain-containing protein [Burkholderiaceae bacterium]|nr:LysM peptidoglycan-binding domain-containing protein [Burkholderiaceae bacterium]
MTPRPFLYIAGLGLALASIQPGFAAGNYPITSQQRATAKQVAEAGVPLSELAPNAPDSHTVVRGDTLWGISKLFLKSPWRWPELWGMNLDQIRNPHLIYPGQLLLLDKSGGRARLRVAQPTTGVNSTVKLSPRARVQPLDDMAIAGVPMHLITPFLNEAVVLDADELATAPRIVAAQEGRVMMARGDTAYVRGDLGGMRNFRVFRQAKPLHDPATKEVLGYEAAYVGTAEHVRDGGTVDGTDGKSRIVPDTFVLTTIRQEAGIGDRLAPVPSRDFSSYAPHAPAQPTAGQIVSVYGEALNAGQNQIVSLNRGKRDGMERGHVLALWRDGASAVDSTDPAHPTLKLPDERHGLLFVFQVFDRVSYALILSAQDPVKAGDRFTQP